MNDTNEHIQRAEAALHFSETRGVESTERQIRTAQAQVHATLALVRAQETANLLALMSNDIGIFTEDHLLHAEYRPLMAELKERMGLA